MNKKEQKEFNQRVVTLLNDIIYSYANNCEGASFKKSTDMMVKAIQLQGLLED